MQSRGVFAGRVIFDHLPKTAGQAVNAWLQGMLGSGAVTTNLIGNHRELIRRYGGEYPVISAHVGFHGEGLDPRYQYVTCFREPIDRAVSWLFFLIQQRYDIGLPEVFRVAQQFVDSDGACEVPAEFMQSLTNPYVNHFAGIFSPNLVDEEEKLSAALTAIERYEVWGLHEAFPEFLADFAGLLGLPAPGGGARVNVTRERLTVDRITPVLRKRLEALNSLDLELYRILRGRYEEARRHWQRPMVSVSQWIPYVRSAERTFTAPEFVLRSARLESGEIQSAGGLLSFCVEFSLARAVSELEMGIHVFDEDGRWAFGTNTTLLKQIFDAPTAGVYRLCYAVLGDLPEGSYTAGFAFAERNSSGVTREIAWYDKLVGFRIALVRDTPSVGYVSLPVAVNCRRIANVDPALVFDARGDLSCQACLGDLRVGELCDVPFRLQNASSQDWLGSSEFPLNLSYSWLDMQGQVYVADGLRTPLPAEGIRVGEGHDLVLRVCAPDVPGRYRLKVRPVQENVCWFDQRGFLPSEQDFEVRGPLDGFEFAALDMRVRAQIGRVEGNARVVDQEEGCLLFGPYVAWAAGQWRLVVNGAFDPASGSVCCDVVAHKGAVVLACRELTQAQDGVELPFVLDEAVEDLEVRVRVGMGGRARVVAWRIDPQPASGEGELQQVKPTVAKERPRKAAAAGKRRSRK